jgi:hypothetical protein
VNGIRQDGGKERADMKRLAISIAALIPAAVLCISCDNGGASGGSAPELAEVFISDSQSGLSGNTETAVFRVGGTAWFRFSVTDEDLDADRILVTQKSGSWVLGPAVFELEAQQAATQHYAGYMGIEYEGNWEISAYCVDRKGNRSGTVEKNVAVVP